MIPTDADTPWKEVLESYFPEFLALFFPEIHAGIDWTKGWRFLDKELRQVVQDAELGRRYADKLVEVWIDGAVEKEKNMPYISSVEKIGIQKGIQMGIQEGLQMGIQEGLQKGLQQGLWQGDRRSVKKLLRKGLSPLEAARLLDLEESLAREIAEELAAEEKSGTE